MIGVTIIAIGVLLIISLEIINLKHPSKRIKVVLIVVVGILLCLSIVEIMNSEDFDSGSQIEGVDIASVYFGWFGEAVVNLWNVGKESVGTVGNAIKIRDNDKS